MQGRREIALELDMPATDSDPRLPSPLAGSGSIRNAQQRDLAEVARLLDASGINTRYLETSTHQPLARGHLLVLDIAGVVHAVAHVSMAADGERWHGRLEYLVLAAVQTSASGRAMQDRLTCVAVALCEAYGCTTIDIGAVHRKVVTAARPALAAHAMVR